jgi:undecaprenyl-diphosphatase
MDDIPFFIFLGIIQGILEWLPVSSSGNITLLLVNIAGTSFSEAVRVSFFLHAGTMLSVLIKFRSHFFTLAKDAISRGGTPLLNFYVAATAASAATGVPLYFLVESEMSEFAGSVLIAFFLVITGIVIRIQKRGLKSAGETTLVDACIVGLAQGISVIPGISRSGMTISALLSRGITQEEALRLSFMLSVPPICGLLVLSFSSFQWVYVLSMGVSFFCSLLSMEILLKTARALNFSYFCFAVAIVTIFLVAIQLL